MSGRLINALGLGEPTNLNITDFVEVCKLTANLRYIVYRNLLTPYVGLLPLIFYKESFQAFWAYTSPYWAELFLRKWCGRAMRSQLAPIKKFVKTVRNHQSLMMSWFKANKQYSSGTVEELNRIVNLVTRKAFGFREHATLKIALFHTMGKLPEPKSTHRFF